MKSIRNVGVFCGAKSGKYSHYEHATRELAALLVKHHIGAVYGGAKIGLMGHLADEMLKRSGSIIGVIPKSLVKVEVAHEKLPTLHIVDSMSERKIIIADNSDAFIMLPGGAGSLDEFFEMMTLAQLGYHTKPYAILNTHGYYDHLLAYLKHAVDEGFLAENDFNNIIVEATPENLINRLLNDLPIYIPMFPANEIIEPTFAES